MAETSFWLFGQIFDCLVKTVPTDKGNALDVNVPHRMKCTHWANLNSLKERSRHDSCKFVKAKVWLPVSPGTNTIYTLCNFVFNFMSKCWWWCLLWVSKSGWRKNLLKHFLHLEPHTNVIIALIRWNFTVIVPLWGKL